MLKSLDIYIVSLKESPRRNACQAVIDNPPAHNHSLRFNFHLFDAIDKHSHYFSKELGYVGLIEDSYAPKWLKSSDWYKGLYGRELFPEELGCYASHYLLWFKCIALNQPIVILEDDFELQANFYESLLDCLNAPFDFVRLYGNFWKADPNVCAIANLDGSACVPTNPKVETLLREHFLLASYEVDSTVAYYLTPKAAKAFVSFSGRFIEPVDQFLNQAHRHSIAHLTYIPLSVRFSKHHASSTIFTADNLDSRKKTYARVWSRNLTRLPHLLRLKRRAQHLYRHFLQEYRDL
ncbi:glycosyltransferase family 25 protein [Helicobacter baculiformis]|uniref:Glycosyltransferase family 25 protein n=1 Tax=Helicobacter baculiformis TaxID=427351 RepID=A0ABV7ZGU4_9HELI|nr:glycosyltransferase family 25 protein [Helicobacter baculiformis]